MEEEGMEGRVSHEGGTWRGVWETQSCSELEEGMWY